MSKEDEITVDEQPKVFSIRNDKAERKANDAKGVEHSMLDINSIYDTISAEARVSGNMPKIIYTEPSVDRSTIEQFQAQNKGGGSKVYFIFGDNDRDNAEANQIENQETIKNRRTSSTGQAEVFGDLSHEEYSKAAIGIVTTQLDKETASSEALSSAFEDSLKRLFEKSRNEVATFVVPAEFDADGNITKINIDTGIATQDLTEESLAKMQTAMKTVFDAIERGDTAFPEVGKDFKLETRDQGLERTETALANILKTLAAMSADDPTRSNAEKEIEKIVKEQDIIKAEIAKAEKEKRVETLDIRNAQDIDNKVSQSNVAQDSIILPDRQQQAEKQKRDILQAIREEIIEKQQQIFFDTLKKSDQQMLAENFQKLPDELKNHEIETGDGTKQKIGEMTFAMFITALDRMQHQDIKQEPPYILLSSLLPDKDKSKFEHDLSQIETVGYRAVHTEFRDSFQDVPWDGPKADKARSQAVIGPDGDEIANLTEKTTTENGITYRTINFPDKLKGKGPVHVSMAAKDKNGNNIDASIAVYFTAHYDAAGQLVEVSSPKPIKFLGSGPDAVGYIKKDGKQYTLPVTKKKYQEMMQEVAKNKGQGIDIEVGLAQDTFGVGKKQQVDPMRDQQKDKPQNLSNQLGSLQQDLPNIERKAVVAEAVVQAKNIGDEDVQKAIQQERERIAQTLRERGVDESIIAEATKIRKTLEEHAQLSSSGTSDLSNARSKTVVQSKQQTPLR